MPRGGGGRTLPAAMGVRLAIETDAEGYEPERVVLELDQQRIALGRAASCDVILPHPSVSTLHATLRQSGTGYAVVDERSTNGVRVGDARLAPERQKPLRSGDELRIGPYRIIVSLGIAVPRATTTDEATALARRLVLTHEVDTRSLLVVNGPRAGERITLPTGPAELRVGRSGEAEVGLDDAECSRHHATLLVDSGSVALRDEGSKNGVLVQGRTIGTRRLHDRDELTIGATVLVFEDPREGAIVSTGRLSVDEPPPPVAPPREPTEPEPVSVEALPGQASEDEALDFVEAPAPTSPREPRPAAHPDQVADRLIYGLAVLVLALSVGAIVWLFGSH